MIFSKTFELSLARNYVSKWGMVHAVRELIQNALDSESPFVYEFSRADDACALTLTSEFTVLTPQTLLLGSTSKADSKDSIGSFGEGYKIALLVLTRLGHDVEMRNGDVLWKPRFRFSQKFGEELLVVDETSLPDKRNKGLTFVVKGLSEEDVSAIRASCIPMQDGVGEIKSTPFGDILLERQGKLYVGGLFICDTELSYGYNVKPEHLKLERDRQTVDGWDLKNITKEMWFATKEWDRIARMIENKVTDVEYAEYGSPELVKEACYRLFKDKNPGAVIAKDQEQLKLLVKEGMTVVVEGSNFYSNVRNSPSYRSMPQVRITTPHQILTDWYEKDGKFHMHESVKAGFRAILKQSVEWKP